MSTPVPIRNRLDVLDAMRKATTLAEAAKSVSFTVSELRSYCWSQHMHAAYIRLERGRAPNHHPGFKPFAPAQRLFGGAATIVKRERNAPTGNAQWRIALTACGHEIVREAIRIRADEKLDRMPRCPVCRAEARA